MDDMHGDAAKAEMLSCRELAQLITDYWEGVLSPADSARFELHMKLCGPCEDYVEQMRMTTGTVASLCTCDVPEKTRTALFSMFRDWKEGRDAGAEISAGV